MKTEVSSEKSTARFNRRPSAFILTPEIAAALGITPQALGARVRKGAFPKPAGRVRNGGRGQPAIFWKRSDVAKALVAPKAE